LDNNELGDQSANMGPERRGIPGYERNPFFVDPVTGKEKYRPIWETSVTPDYDEHFNKKFEKEKKVFEPPWIDIPHQKDIKRDLTINELIYMGRHTNVTASGRVFSFSATVVIGNGRGTASVGYGKGKKPRDAIKNARKDAMKNMITLPRYQFTIPRGFSFKWRGCKIFAHTRGYGKGSRGSPLLLTLATAFGLKDITCKVYHCQNPRKIVYTFMKGLIKFSSMSPEAVAKYTGRKFIDWNNVWQQRPPNDDSTNRKKQNFEKPITFPSSSRTSYLNVYSDKKVMDFLGETKENTNYFPKNQETNEW